MMCVGFTVSFADTADVPHTFQSGEPIVASEMNQNFQALEKFIKSLFEIF